MLQLAFGLRTAAWRGAHAQASLVVRSTQRSFAIVPDNTDTHDDFKTQYKSEPATNIEDQIKKDVSSNLVFVYMKGVPEAPQCGFSNMACRVLDAYGVKFGARNVLADPNLREGIKKFTSWPTIPQIFINGEFVGGADILYNMHQDGELEKVLQPIKKQQQEGAK